jgi:hypothetical protein
LKIIRKRLPYEKKKSLLKKYQTNKNCLLLRGPKLNDEILTLSKKTGIKNDILHMYEQNHISGRLVALGQAIYDLNNKTNLKQNEGIINILETLNDAAAIILDVQYNITKKWQLTMLPNLNKMVRSIAQNFRADEWLFGKDLGQKIKDIKSFGKNKKIWKKRISENLCNKVEMQRRQDYDDDAKLKNNFNESDI